jgi:catechol 2,3-dioxygenase-like lactoylglutathione lyase family enzyme
MQTVKLQGVTLHVADVEQSLEFYRKLPGTKVVAHRPGQFALLSVGLMRLGLLRQSTAQFHLEFETEDLDALYRELQAIDFPLLGSPSQKSWGGRDFLVTDPDGYMLEFGSAWQDDTHPESK